MNEIVINDVHHKLVKVEDRSQHYCSTCSLYQRCLIKRQLCGIFNKPIWWHFEISSVADQTE